MTISRFSPPLDYLQAASRASLQSFELARLNHAANLRREIAALIDQWVKESSEAMLARWMLDHHKSLRPAATNPDDVVRAFSDPATSSLEESLLPLSDVVPAPPQLAEPRIPMRTPVPRRPQKQRSAAG